MPFKHDWDDDRLDPYELFMLALNVLAISSLILDSFLPLDAGTRELLDLADLGLCAVFFIDFCLNLVHARDRLRYLRTWGWIDLLSSLPAHDWFMIGRVARVFRILRAIRAARAVMSFLMQRRPDTAFFAVTALSMLLVVSAAAVVLRFESAAEGANIRTPQDALWWSAVTITTVGFGDRYPVTDGGRAVAALLMFSGVGLFGTLSGLIAAWLLAPAQREESELQRLRREVSEMRSVLERLAHPPPPAAGHEDRPDPNRSGR